MENNKIKHNAYAPICNYCNKPAKLVDSKVLYGYAKGHIWLCSCGAYVGTHKNSTKPKGTLADRETRKARIKAHEVFDSYWKTRFWTGNSRRQARIAGYKWLADQMGMDLKQCHIGKFNAQQCQRVIEIVERFKHYFSINGG